MLRTLSRTVAIGILLALAAVAVDFGRPSATAAVTLQLRALGAKLPDEQLRNPDQLAAAFLGERERAILTAMPQGRIYIDMDFDTAWREMPEIQRRVFLHVLARTRAIDDALRQAVASGVNQIVILGAGYDSRAYRLRELLSNATIYELDLPASQAYKRQRVREIIGEPPSNLRYVTTDFAKQDLGQVLVGSGFDLNRKAFFIWEGVTMYLPETAVSATLRFVARSAEGSTLVFDYEQEQAIRGDHDDEILKASNARLAKIGEPHIFGFAGSPRAFVTRLSLDVVFDLSPADITRTYLTRRDGTRLGEERWSNGICVVRTRRRLPAAIRFP